MRAINFNTESNKLTGTYNFDCDGTPCTITADGRGRFTIVGKDGEPVQVEQIVTARGKYTKAADLLRLAGIVGNCTSGIYKESVNILLNDDYEANEIYTGRGGYHSHNDRGVYTNKAREACQYYIGVELETEHRNDQCFAALNKLQTNLFWRERDGSLLGGSSYDTRGGIEYISIPLRPQDARRPDFWNDGILRQIGLLAKSADTEGRCGLHIHISRTAAGATAAEQEDTILRVAYLHELQLTEEDKKTIYGRGAALDSYARPTKKDPVTLQYLEACKYFDISPRQGWEKAKKGLTITGRDTLDDHASRINLQHPATYEFRQGKGSLDGETIAARVQFIIALFEFCKDRPNIDKITRAAFLKYLKSEPKYKHAAARLNMCTE